MFGTSKASRARPTQVFESYVLTKTVGPEAGLSSIPIERFSRVPGGVGQSFATSSVSAILPIGFDFLFNNVTYKNVVISNSGWLALVSPTETQVANVTGSLLLSSSYENQGISLSNTTQNVLLCPWFDHLRNTANTVTTSVGGQSVSNISRRIEGLDAPYTSADYVSDGVRFFNSQESDGKKLIVRWSSLTMSASLANDISHVKFESVLRENGNIEFRYCPKNELRFNPQHESTTFDNGTIHYYEKATIGVFVSGSNRFRDFAYGLGVGDERRPAHDRGGADYSPGFTDTATENITDQTINEYVSRQYVWTLRPRAHWPGTYKTGATLTFIPPQNLRIVLPRHAQRLRDERSYRSNSTFDDRRTLLETTGSVVTYPARLRRFQFGSNVETALNQDLFFGGLQVTSSVSMLAADEFATNVERKSFDRSFNEHSHKTIVSGSASDLFYVSGSSVDLFGERLSQHLGSKETLKLSLPVNFTTKMFSISSSIYYYNVKHGWWQVPNNSRTEVADGGSQGGESDIGSPAMDASLQRVLEDGRGFGPIGNVLASGSVARSGTESQSDPSIRASFSLENLTVAIGKKYNKGVQHSSIYDATDDETFKLSLTEPFVIEKAIVEIPLAAGAGWFDDRTSCFQPLETTTGSFDFGGPALTVAMFNQVVLGSELRRELIFSGTITHINDATSSLTFSSFPSYASSSHYHVRPVGFNAYANAACVVTQNVGSTFTGSAVVPCVAGTSNGCVASVRRHIAYGTSAQNRQDLLDLFNVQTLPVATHTGSFFQHTGSIAYPSPLGRAAAGIVSSGRSIFGRESVPSTKLSNEGRVTNPFFLAGTPRDIANVSDGSLPPQFVEAINSGSQFTALAAIPLLGHSPSPYVVHPGDSLVLSVSKTRPFFFGTVTATPRTSGSITHDVQLVTGTLRVTLFGSYLRNDREIVGSPFTIATPSVYSSIANDDRLLDQFDVGFTNELTSSYVDDYVTGSLVSKTIGANRVTVLTTGSRGLVIGFLAATTSSFPTTDSTAFNSQPWSERVGSLRMLGLDDTSERYWDSLMPAIDQCLAANGSSIWTAPSLDSTFNPSGKRVGYIEFDRSSVGLSNNLDAMFDDVWTKAFPLEPRYSSVTRQLDIKKGFISRINYSGPSADAIDPHVIDDLIVSNVLTASHPTRDVGSNFHTDYLVNVVSGISGAASSDDISKVLFGFGDARGYGINPDGNIYGTNHYATFRNIYYIGTFANRVVRSPVIRGWKYGVSSGLPQFSRAHFRRNRFGQPRDMLEQRRLTKFYVLASDESKKEGPSDAVVDVKFIDVDGRTSSPDNTWSQNLSFECTSSVPFFDGETRNRPSPETSAINTQIVNIKTDQFGKIKL